MKAGTLRQLLEDYRVSHEETGHGGVLPGEVTLIRAMQAAQGQEACFLTDHRYYCRHASCEWRNQCLRLVAAWRR